MANLVSPQPMSWKPAGAPHRVWLPSSDGLNFTFKLRNGLKFESGRPVTADDVVFSLHRVIQLNKAGVFLLGQFGWTKENIEALIKAPDQQTVTLTLPQLYATDLVLYCLSTLTAGVVLRINSAWVS